MEIDSVKTASVERQWKGKLMTASEQQPGTHPRSEVSYCPATGEPNGELPTSSLREVEVALDSASKAARAFAGLAPAERKRYLDAIADALEANADGLIDLADRETGLGQTRLKGELARAASQLRFYGDVAVEGFWLAATLEEATDTTSALARVNTPLGPVAVFGASNFPFAFGVLGNDTASALAAGCPVVVKAHPAHPLLSQALMDVAQQALNQAGAAHGVLSMVVGFDAGRTIVVDPRIRAVAFTGSQSGGLSLWQAANERDEVVPVFAEMGTVNPVVMTHAAVSKAGEIARGFVGSFTLGAGQFCTKPGILLAPKGSGVADEVACAVSDVVTHPMLTAGIAQHFEAGIEAFEAAGARVLAQGVAPPEGWCATPTVLAVEASAVKRGSVFTAECFGPVALIVEYADAAARDDVLTELQGSLVATVASAGVDDPEIGELVALLSAKVGRVTVDDWPTGVAWNWAQHHSGPWPATSAPSATSVGAAALDRFTRPIAYQNVPDTALPKPLQASNPWGVPRRENGKEGVTK